MENGYTTLKNVLFYDFRHFTNHVSFAQIVTIWPKTGSRMDNVSEIEFLNCIDLFSIQFFIRKDLFPE